MLSMKRFLTEQINKQVNQIMFIIELIHSR